MCSAVQQELKEQKIKQVLHYVERRGFKFGVACGMAKITKLELLGPERLKDHPQLRRAKEISLTNSVSKKRKAI